MSASRVRAVPLATIVEATDRELRTRFFTDYAGAHNGLQLENGGTVRRIAAAVDCHRGVIERAVAEGAELLVVHHGMLWQGGQPWTGGRYHMLQRALAANLAVYSSHLPLDAHPRLGNNVLLARAMGLRGLRPFFSYKGHDVGLRAEGRWNRAALVRRLQAVVGGTVHCLAGGPGIVRRVGVITGGAGSEVAAVAAEGVDTLITGEAPHWVFGLAQDLGMNVLLGGHYGTETFGVKALGAWLSRRFRIPWSFLDCPSGL
jgi:dinuclear metal center YbgI/SA1388 family protein